jgi:hypothetical protein
MKIITVGIDLAKNVWAKALRRGLCQRQPRHPLEQGLVNVSITCAVNTSAWRRSMMAVERLLRTA